MKNVCVCQSGKLFQQCCSRFLNQQQLAKTPLQLMRSRYSAFALGGYGEYLLTTWSPSMVSGMSVAELSMRTTDWIGLEIVDKSQKGEQGFVEFKALFKGENGKESVHHEKSVFERIDGRWMYVCGDVS